MSEPAFPDLVKVTEIFLVPSSFLVAALGTADTNFHRAAVSLLGLIISGLWWSCSREAHREAAAQSPTAVPPRRMRVLVWLPAIFLGGWLTSLAVHLMLIGKPLGMVS